MSLMLRPPPDLLEWVEAAVIVSGDRLPATARFPALTCAMLVVRIGGETVIDDGPALPAISLIPPSSRASQHRVSADLHAIGLVLRPQAAGILMRDSLAGLADQRLDGLDVFDRRIASALRAVRDARLDADRVRLLFDAIRVQVDDPRSVQRLNERRRLMALLEGDLAQASRLLGVSSRQLQRISLNAFGLSPKQIQSIHRVRRTLHAALRPTVVERPIAADLAQEQGFFDQSHMRRDLRRFAQTSITELRDAQPDLMKSPHWPLAVGLASG